MTSAPAGSALSSHGAPALLGVRLGFVTAARRLVSRGAIVTGVLAVALSIAAGIIERRITTAGAVDRSLASTFRLVLPLYAFALATRASERNSLREAAWSVARFGAARRDVALGISSALALFAAISGALLAGLAVLSAHSAASLPLGRDLFTSAWIGGLVAAAYTGWFVLGATFFSRGRGRFVPLVVDLVFGSGTGFLAALSPRSHAHGLLGEEGPLGFSQPESSVALLLMAVVLPVIAALRCRD